MILPRRRTALIGNRTRGTVLAAGAAGVAELRDAGVDRMVDRQVQRPGHPAHPEQRSERRMNDRAVPSELTEAGLQADRDVQQVTVANRMLDGARIAEGREVRGEFDDRLTQREVDAQALDRRLTRWDDLELAPPHALADRDRVAVLDRPSLIDVGGLDLANAGDVGAEGERLLFQVG